MSYMLKNYIKTAYRTLKKNKGFTAINILGLALGLATCLLIMFYVLDELSYDQYNLKADRIFRVNNDIKFGGNDQSFAVSPPVLASTLMKNYPEVEQAVRFRYTSTFMIKKGPENFRESNVVYVDPNVFDVFTLPMISGNPATALTEPHTVVITETTAKRYFNSTQAVGKILTVNDTSLYKVTGVIKDIPKQSHFNFDFLMSMASFPPAKENIWFSNNFNTYVLLKPGFDYHVLDAKLPALMHTYAGPQLQAILHVSFEQFEAAGNVFRLDLTPLKDVYLRSNRVAELGANGNILYVYLFSAIAIFILVIACVNFMNLSTARSSNRAREVGVRKVLGSAQRHLILQFLSESVMITLIAAAISLIAAWLLLPLFNQMSGKTLEFTFASLTWLTPLLIAGAILIGCLAGSYPAFFLSAFKPIDVLKGKLSTGFKGGRLRSFLVVFQFFISIVLIIGTLVIYNQLKYIQSKDLGYSRDQVLIIHHTDGLGNQDDTFKQEVRQLPGVVSASMTDFLPLSMGNRNSSSVFQDRTLDQKKAVLAQVWVVDVDYAKTMGLKFAFGRDFSSDMKTDSTGMIINQSAARLMGVGNPVNKELYLPQDNMIKKLKTYHIIGVVKDFNFNSLRENITPVILFLGKNNGSISIKAKTNHIDALLAQVKDKWKSIAPNKQFDYSFMDKDFEESYRVEQRMGTIFITFTTMAIVIACLGLFGLAAYAAEQRTKEIGIRKVMGASVSTIVTMLSKDFIKLVLLAIIIAAPVAWYSMDKWFLQSFAYRQNIQWWVIALAGALSILIAFITISFQSLKAALANPVKSLKNE